MDHPTFRPFLLERYFAAHEHAVPHALSASDCEPWRLADLLAATGLSPDALLDLRLGYTQSRGDPRLRTAIAAHYPSCGADDVLVAGAPQEAIALTMQTLLGAGDRVVVMTPCYQSLRELPRALGCRVDAWPVRRDAVTGAFALDLDQLAALLAEPCALLVTNFPHNPTGVQPTPAQWRRLTALVEASGARWFSDEMYRGLAADDAAELPPAAGLSGRAVSLWGLSKSFGLAGLRLGWLVSRDRELLSAIEARKDYSSICSNALSEVVGRAAVAQAGALCAGNRARIAANAARMAAFAAQHDDLLRWHPPQAGPVGLCELPAGSATAMADRVRAHGALLVPATLFDLDDRHLRVGLGRDGFAAALDCWDAALRAP